MSPTCCFRRWSQQSCVEERVGKNDGTVTFFREARSNWASGIPETSEPLRPGPAAVCMCEYRESTVCSGLRKEQFTAWISPLKINCKNVWRKTVWKEKEKCEMTELRRAVNYFILYIWGYFLFCIFFYTEILLHAASLPPPHSLISSPTVKLFLLWSFSLRPLPLSPQVSVLFLLFSSFSSFALSSPVLSVLTLHILYAVGEIRTGANHNDDANNIKRKNLKIWLVFNYSVLLKWSYFSTHSGWRRRKYTYTLLYTSSYNKEIFDYIKRCF